MRSVLCALALLASATGFYLPGVTPKTFAKGEAVKIRVNRLTSTETFLPYDYYDLPFPEPEAGVKEMPENLGEYLTANRIENSPYKVKMMVDQNCQLLARQETTKEGMAKFRQFIKDGYHINWIMDNLPSAGAIDDEESKTQTTVYDIGFPLGLKRVHKGKYIGTQVTWTAHRDALKVLSCTDTPPPPPCSSTTTSRSSCPTIRPPLAPAAASSASWSSRSP
jgi:hypothetical protein